MIKGFYNSGGIQAIVYSDTYARAFNEDGSEVEAIVKIRDMPALKQTEILVFGPEYRDDERDGPMRQVYMQYFKPLKIK